MIIKREADNTYSQFEYRYTGIVVINKAVRVIDTVVIEANRKGYNFLDLKLAENLIDDLNEKASFTYKAIKIIDNLLFPDDSGYSRSGESYIGRLFPETDYYVTITVNDDPNYKDAISKEGYVVSTLEVPTTSWADHTEFFNGNADTINIQTAGQLALLAREIKNGTFDSKGKTFILENDIDLTGHI